MTSISINQLVNSSAPLGFQGSTATQRKKVQASDAAANTYFGSNVAQYDDIVAITAYGADSNRGAVYVFSKSTGTQIAKLQASDGVAGDLLGESVAVYNNTLVTGSIDKNSATGAVYVFVKSTAGSWSQQAILTASGGAIGDLFGKSVAIYENTICVGASGANSSTGKIYIFTRSGTTWSQVTSIAGTSAGDEYGYSVALEGHILAVGSPEYLNKGKFNIYTGEGSSWTSTFSTSDDAVEGDNYGFSLSLSGSTLAVGAYGYDASRGKVYVYTLSSGTWTLQQTFQALVPSASSSFGRTLSIFGDVLVVGSPYYDTPPSNSGATYVFTRSGVAWTQQHLIQSSDIESGDLFGIGISVFGGNIMVGAKEEDTGFTNAGAAYFFSIPTLDVSSSFTTNVQSLTSHNSLNARTVTTSENLVVGKHTDIMGNLTVAGTSVSSGNITGATLYASSGVVDWGNGQLVLTSSNEPAFKYDGLATDANYAVKQTNLGVTHLNASTSRSVDVNINNTRVARFNETELSSEKQIKFVNGLLTAGTDPSFIYSTLSAATDYALKQNSTGSTYINAKTGGTVNMGVNDAVYATMTNTALTNNHLFRVTDVTDSTSLTTGSVVLSGGVAVTKQLRVGTDCYVDGLLDVDGLVEINNTTDSTSLTTGSVVLSGGVAVTKQLRVGTDCYVDGLLDVDGLVEINNTTDSTTTTSGALQVDGGVGIQKALNVGTTCDVKSTTNGTTYASSHALTVSGSARTAGNIFIQNGFSLVVGASFASDTERVRIHHTATDGYIDFGTGSLFVRRSDTGACGYWSNSMADAGLIDFTGQHRAKLESLINISEDDQIGLIVISTGKYANLDCSTIPNINESLPVVDYSTTPEDIRVYGVISGKEPEGVREYNATGSYISIFNKIDGIDRLFINSLGEGAIWVCNMEGNLKNGNYITTCQIPGYGVLQKSNQLYNYTVAKITCDINFNIIPNGWKCKRITFKNKDYLAVFVGCTYHCG